MRRVFSAEISATFSMSKNATQEDKVIPLRDHVPLTDCGCFCASDNVIYLLETFDRKYCHVFEDKVDARLLTTHYIIPTL